MRFIHAAFLEGPAAFYVSTTRICRGRHDERCTHYETQTFGPLQLLEGDSGDLYACPRCRRVQPPVAEGQKPICLFCSDASAVIEPGDSRTTTAATAAVAALYSASRLAALLEPDMEGELLKASGDTLRMLLELTAMEIKQEPLRHSYAFNKIMLRLARLIMTNARAVAKEPFPVRENEED